MKVWYQHYRWSKTFTLFFIFIMPSLYFGANMRGMKSSAVVLFDP